MNSRRFYFIVTIFISLFLFIIGMLLLKTYNVDDSTFAFIDKSEAAVSPGDATGPITDNKSINVLLLVGDKWEESTDTIIMANYNIGSGKLSLISIPRDTMVDLTGMPIPKINAVYTRSDGKNEILKCVSDLLGIEVKYYVYFNLSTFRELVDLLGGVDINIPVDLDYDDPVQNLHIHFKKGLQHLDGNKAELYLRFRKPNDDVFTDELLKYYDGSDIMRIEAQKNFITELIKQKAKLFYLAKLSEIINTVYNNLQTNIPIGQAIELVQYGIGFEATDLATYSLPGTDQIIEEYYYFISSKLKTADIIKAITGAE